MSDASTEGIKTVLNPVTDLDRAKKIYTTLIGIEPQADAEYYVGFDVAGQHLGLVPGGGPQGMSAQVAYWQVDDLDGKLAALVAVGATVKEDPREVGNGRRVATLADADGNLIGLMQDA